MQYVDENNTLIERMTCDQNMFSIMQRWYMVVIKLCSNSSMYEFRPDEGLWKLFTV